MTEAEPLGFDGEALDQLVEDGLTPEQEEGLKLLLAGLHPAFQKTVENDGSVTEFYVHTINPNVAATHRTQPLEAGFSFAGLVEKQADPAHNQVFAYFVRREPSKSERVIRAIGGAVDAVFLEEMVRAALKTANAKVAAVLDAQAEQKATAPAEELGADLVKMLEESLAESPVTPIGPSAVFGAPLDESVGPVAMDPNDAAVVDREIGRQVEKDDQ